MGEFDPPHDQTILNSLDVHSKRVVDELDFFGNKKGLSNYHASRIDMITKETLHNQVTEQFNLGVNTSLNLLTTNALVSDKSTVDDGASPEGDKRTVNRLMIIKGEMERIKAENERLKSMLNQLNNEYCALQMHAVTLVDQQHHNQKPESANRFQMIQEELEKRKEGVLVPRQFMDLGQATNSDHEEKEHSFHSLSGPEGRFRECSTVGSPQRADKVSMDYDNKRDKNIPKSENIIIIDTSSDQRNLHCGKNNERLMPGEETSVKKYEELSPNKVPKFHASSDFDHQAAEARMRKARVSVRARSEASMISDGCQWRKYGQKMAKGNPCPRAYYRCTMAAGCPAGSQVQRCAEDQTILTRTYEGNHNHPLPAAAMSMASTTSAAATMLLLGSMPSSDWVMNANSSLLARTLLLPCSPNLAMTAPFPTVTLDLTNPSVNPSQLQRSLSQLRSTFFHDNVNNLSSGRPQNNNGENESKFLQNSQEIMSAAATAAITSDPNFSAALVAAITSIMGANGQLS